MALNVMTDRTSNTSDVNTVSSVRIIKREPTRMPSIWRNMLFAILFLVLLAVVGVLLFSRVQDPRDANAGGDIAVAPLPLPNVQSALEETSSDLPDLLSEDVPVGQNPTRSSLGQSSGQPSQFANSGRDALGNPIVGGVERNGTSLAGSENAASRVQSQATGETVSQTGPRVILIDGQPIDSPTSSSSSAAIISAQPSKDALIRAPIAGLSKSGPFGRVPSKATDGRTPLTSYARPFTPTAGRYQLSVVIGGLGLNQAVTNQAIYELPPNVTLSFAAHAPGLQTWINKARAQGHEVLLELPMEGENFNATEPGANYALRVSNTASKNIRNLDYLLSRAQGYFAVTNYSGSALFKRADVLTPILTHLSDTGVGFIYDGAVLAPSLSALSETTSLPYTKAYNILDVNPSPSFVRAELSRLEQQARTKQTALAVGFTFPETINAVKSWSQSLDAKSIEIAPASYFVRTSSR